MRRTCLGFALLLTLAPALLPGPPLLAFQAGPQARSKAEYDAYVALYNEAAPGAKAALGEAFLRDYPESEFAPLAFMNLISAYEMERDWAAVLAAANRFQTTVVEPDETARNFVYPRALMAAQMQNDIAGIIAFGDLLLEVSPNNLGAMLTLGSVYTENLPTTEPARGRALARAYDLANRARVQAQQFFAGDGSRTAERTQVEVTIHTTLARVHYARSDYQRAADEFQQVADMDPTDAEAYYRLGDCYQFLAAAASRDVQTAVAARTQAEAQGTDQATIDQMQARFEVLQGNVLAYLDRSIDAFASATAIGGPIASDARLRLEPLYRSRHEDSLEGLEGLLEEKRAALRNR